MTYREELDAARKDYARQKAKHGSTCVECVPWMCAPTFTDTQHDMPVITNEEAVAAQRYDQELIELAADQIYRAAGDLYRECARADRLESENDRLSSYERRTRNPHNDWVPE